MILHLYRLSIGLDGMFKRLENAGRAQPTDAWPPDDVIKVGDDDDQITMAAAGPGLTDGGGDTAERHVLVSNRCTGV